MGYIDKEVAEKAIAALMPSMSTPDGSGENDHLVLAAQEMCVDAMETIRELPEVDATLVAHGKRIKSRKHRWKTYEDGELDICAWDEGYCNGPICIDCGEHFCVHCLEREGGETAVKQKLEEEACEEKTLCSICGRVVPKDAPYCNCGAKMDLEE